MLDITRNQYYAVGLVLLFLGAQFRLVDSLVLTPELTQFLAEQTGHPLAAVNTTTQSLMQLEKPIARKTVRPPDWLGWSLLSLGAVLVLQSVAMKKPE